MKPEELMIGDWVFNKHHGHPIKMTQFDFFTHGHKNGEKYLLPNAKLAVCRDIEPIPLTKEILEKNGFNGDGYVYLKIDEHSFLEYYFHEKRLRKIWKGIDEWQNHSKVRDITFQCNCYYVHELQHALKLCEIEKEIEL